MVCILEILMFVTKSCVLLLQMTMQLGESCDGCEYTGGNTKRRCDESFTRQYNTLSKVEVVAALMVPSKELFTRLAQTVACVGCRRRLVSLVDGSWHSC